MIPIDLLGKKPPDKWIKKAEKALDLLEQEPDPDVRKKLIEKNQQVWKDLRDWLLELSANKCWFSEAKDCFQDWDVEHFRPKKSAKNLDGTEREGYWWLSFDWTNLRICGRVGNNKKGTFFPLATAYCASSQQRDLLEEVPFLLDPIKPSDCSLLSFDQLGRAVPASGLDNWSITRVEVSIKRYKLYFDRLEIQRKAIWDTCEQLIAEIQHLMREQEKNPGAGKQGRIEEKMNQLRKYVHRESVCAGVARACLEKSQLGWARRMATYGG